MKRLLLLCLAISLTCSINAQTNEHSDRRTSITIGGFNPIIPKAQLQFEHFLGSAGTQHWTIGENIQYHFGLLNLDDVFIGPKISLFGRYYFKDQTIKHGKDWFIQAKGGFAYLSNPFSEFSDAVLTVNGIPQVNPNNPTEPFYMFIDEDYTMTYGGGIAFGYRGVSCNGWVWEAFLGYHYWTTPQLLTSEFSDYFADEKGDYDIIDSNGDVSEIVEEELLWWYGFPIDLQFKVGKVLNW